MQTRFSTCRGIEIVEESTGDVLGTVSDVLIHPDKGTIMGFFVAVGSQKLYLSALDILHFGSRIAVRDAHALCDPFDIVRLQPLLEDRRRVLDQRIRTEGGRTLGRCKDVQFDSESMHITWLFPKHFFRWKSAIPIRDVLEVRQNVIIVQSRKGTAPEMANEKEALFTAPLSEPSL